MKAKNRLISSWASEVLEAHLGDCAHLFSYNGDGVVHSKPIHSGERGDQPLQIELIYYESDEETTPKSEPKLSLFLQPLKDNLGYPDEHELNYIWVCDVALADPESYAKMQAKVSSLVHTLGMMDRIKDKGKRKKKGG